MLKLLHTADVHLGAKFAVLGEKAPEQREQLKKTFSRIVQLAIDEGVDIILVAGDFFDSNQVSQNIIDFVKSEFKKLEKRSIFVCISPGGHDCLSPDSVYLRENFGKFFKNVYVFTEPKTTSKEYPELNLTVHAKPNTMRQSDKSPLENLKLKIKNLKFRVAMAHGSMQIPGKSSEKDFPVKSEEIAGSDFDYIALGHWHSLGDYSQGKVKAFYSGSPEPIDITQKKAGFVVLAEIDEGGEVKVTPKKIGLRDFEEIDIDLSGVKELDQLKKLIVKDAHKNLIRIVNLKGLADSKLLINEEEIEEELEDKFFRLKIIDRSHLRLEVIDKKKYPEELVVGQFVRLMQEKIRETKNKKERKIAEEALQTGVAELEGRRVI